MSALTGRAWAETEELDVQRLVARDGWIFLLEFLQNKFLKNSNVRRGEAFAAYFFGTSRDARESMQVYINRQLPATSWSSCCLSRPDLATYEP